MIAMKLHVIFDFCVHWIEKENKSTWSSFMKRELFLFSDVLEFPNASNRTFASGIMLANEIGAVPEKNFNKCFVFSVFPEPVTPRNTIDWGFSKTRKFLSALSPIEIIHARSMDEMY